MKRKYWITAVIVLIIALIVWILPRLLGTEGGGTSIITLKCQAVNDCKYIENPPIPGKPGCYNLKEQGNLIVNNSIQCECINNVCLVKTDTLPASSTSCDELMNLFEIEEGKLDLNCGIDTDCILIDVYCGVCVNKNSNIKNYKNIHDIMAEKRCIPMLECSYVECKCLGNRCVKE